MKNNTSVVLGDYYERLLEEKVRSGRYGSKSEVIRAGLRLLDERESQLDFVKRALIEGEESGSSEYTVEGLFSEINSELDSEQR